MLVATLRPAGWDVTSLPRVASNTELGAFARHVDPHFHTVTTSPYDGQFYWAIAVDPVAVGKAHDAIDKPTYRYGHPLLGWLGWLFAGGQAGAAAAALLAAGLLSLAAAAAIAARLGTLAAALFTCLSPGLVYAAVHGLGEPLALALLLGALLADRHGRWWPLLVCCALLPFAKEQLVVVPIILAAWRRRPVLLASLVPVVLWWTYARIHLGGWFTSGETALGAPLAGWKRAVLDAGVHAADGSDETTLLVLVALLALLTVATILALRLRSPLHAIFVVLAVITACLAPNATVILRDALRNTALLVALVPFVYVRR